MKTLLCETGGDEGLNFQIIFIKKFLFGFIYKYICIFYFADPETFARSENPTLRRLSMKPEAMKAFTHRRDSYFDGARRRSTLRRLSSVNKVKLAFLWALSLGLKVSKFRKQFMVTSILPNSHYPEYLLYSG